MKSYTSASSFNSTLIGELFHRISINYSILEQYFKAIKYLKKSKQMYKNTNCNEQIIVVEDLSCVYQLLHDYKNSIKYKIK